MLRSVVHVNVSFVQGDNYESICIHPHVDIQLDLQHLFFLFSIVWFWLLCQNQVLAGVWVHFWVFDFIPLFNLFVCMLISCSFYYDCSVVRLEIADVDALRNYFIIQNIFWLSWIFVFERKLRIAVSSSVHNCVGILMGNALNLKMIFVRWPFSPC